MGYSLFNVQGLMQQFYCVHVICVLLQICYLKKKTLFASISHIVNIFYISIIKAGCILDNIAFLCLYFLCDVKIFISIYRPVFVGV